MDPKVIFDVGKFFYDLYTSKTPFDTFKIVLTKAYFEVVEKETQCQEITQDFIENILKNPEYPYSEEKIFETKNIKDNEFFLYLHTEVKKECPEISDSYIKENIQLAVESELYYNKDNLNIKGLQDYLTSSYFKERKKLILKRAYQEKLSELYYKNNLSENFIEPSFNKNKHELKDIYDKFAQNVKHIWIFGRKGEGKTSTAYKVLNDRPFKILYYLNFHELIHENDAQERIFDRLKDKLVKDNALSIEENIDNKNALIIIDDFKSISYLDNFLNLLNKDKYLKDYNILILASLDLSKKITSEYKFILDKYNPIKVKNLLEEKIDEVNNPLFLQIFYEDKNIEEQYNFFQDHLHLEDCRATFDYYIGKISKEELDNSLGYKQYLSNELIDYFATDYLIKMILEEAHEQVNHFFSQKNISKRVIYALSKHEELYDIKLFAKKQLNKILINENTKLFGKDIKFKTLHCFYAYWSIFNLGDAKDFININTEDKTKEDKKAEAIQKINLIYLIKIYKSIYHEQELKFYGQKFTFYNNEIFNDFDITNELFIKTDLSYSLIEDCDFSGLILDKVDFSNSKTINTKFDRCLLDNIDFSDSVIKDCDFSGLVLDKVDFSNSKIINTKFDGCLLDNIDFSNTSLEKITISTLNYSEEFEINESFLKNFNSLQKITFERLDLSGIDFRTLKSLTGFSFKKCDLTDCIFDHDLSNVDFSESNLTNAEFHNSIFSNTDFTGADLSYVSIDNIKIKGNIFLDKTKGLDTLKDEIKTKEAL